MPRPNSIWQDITNETPGLTILDPNCKHKLSRIKAINLAKIAPQLLNVGNAYIVEQCKKCKGIRILKEIRQERKSTINIHQAPKCLPA